MTKDKKVYPLWKKVGLVSSGVILTVGATVLTLAVKGVETIFFCGKETKNPYEKD
jgi:hypothetical protein